MQFSIDGFYVRAATGAPYLILAGLLLLIAEPWWPSMPVITAVALVALGACLAGLKRWQRTAGGPYLCNLQLLVYMGLFSAMVGGKLYETTRDGQTLGVAGAGDLAIASVLMALAVFATFLVVQDPRCKSHTHRSHH